MPSCKVLTRVSGVVQLFYFIWGNCMVSFGFMVSTFFNNTRTAVVAGASPEWHQVLVDNVAGDAVLEQHLRCGLCQSVLRTPAAYLWVVGTGLLGYLMLEQFIDRGDSWCGQGHRSMMCLLDAASRTKNGQSALAVSRVWALELIPSFALYRGLYEYVLNPSPATTEHVLSCALMQNISTIFHVRRFAQYAFLHGYGVRLKDHT